MYFTNAFSSLAFVCWVFPPMQSSNGAKYSQNTDKSAMDNVSCIAQVCLFIVWFDKTCSCELAKVDSLFLWNLHPRLHLKLALKHRVGSLNELISDSSFEGFFQHTLLWVYIPNPWYNCACMSGQLLHNIWGKRTKHILLFHMDKYPKKQRISALSKHSVLQCSVVEWEHTCMRKLAEKVLKWVHVRIREKPAHTQPWCWLSHFLLHKCFFEEVSGPIKLRAWMEGRKETEWKMEWVVLRVTELPELLFLW